MPRHLTLAGSTPGQRRARLEEASPMKLSTMLSLLSLGTGAVALVIAACSSDSTPGGDDAAQVGKIPPAEEGAPTAGTDERTFALNSLHLGEADRGGVKNPNAWKKYG